MAGLLGHLSAEDREYIDRIGLENFMNELKQSEKKPEKAVSKDKSWRCRQYSSRATSGTGSRKSMSTRRNPK